MLTEALTRCKWGGTLSQSLKTLWVQRAAWLLLFCNRHVSCSFSASPRTPRPASAAGKSQAALLLPEALSPLDTGFGSCYRQPREKPACEGKVLMLAHLALPLGVQWADGVSCPQPGERVLRCRRALAPHCTTHCRLDQCGTTGSRQLPSGGRIR